VNLISYSSHAEELKEWTYYDEDEAGGGRGGEPLGPVTKEEVRKVSGRFVLTKVCHQCSNMLFCLCRHASS